MRERNISFFSFCLTALLSFLLFENVAAQGKQAFDFCDIPCVDKVYQFYCGGAKCTTGASDYVQIFAMCTDSCTSAIIGEAMLECLKKEVPIRNDWHQVQLATSKQIFDFCEGYDILLDTSVAPLTKKDTDKAFLDSLFEDISASTSPKSKKAAKKSTSENKKTKARGEVGIKRGGKENAELAQVKVEGDKIKKGVVEEVGTVKSKSAKSTKAELNKVVEEKKNPEKAKKVKEQGINPQQKYRHHLEKL